MQRIIADQIFGLKAVKFQASTDEITLSPNTSSTSSYTTTDVVSVKTFAPKLVIVLGMRKLASSAAESIGWGTSTTTREVINAGGATPQRQNTRIMQVTQSATDEMWADLTAVGTSSFSIQYNAPSANSGSVTVLVFWLALGWQ